MKERAGGLDGWKTRGATCYNRASVLQHLCGCSVCACALARVYMHPCPCLCVSLLMDKSRERELPHRNVCSHCPQLLVGVETAHTKKQWTGPRGANRETGELQVTWKVKIMWKRQQAWSCVWRCPFIRDRVSLFKLRQWGTSVASSMAARLYSVPPTWADSIVFTAIDFLSFSIWKNMAHTAGEDARIKPDLKNKTHTVSTLHTNAAHSTNISYDWIKNILMSRRTGSIY